VNPFRPSLYTNRIIYISTLQIEADLEIAVIERDFNRYGAIVQVNTGKYPGDRERYPGHGKGRVQD